ncbi:hypothetical protein ACQEVB_33700 [Pseudonocardia sp. CA-107938]|uniref:hypothetical protein n=1 Tax=Pseudonocardia sp. CA-107938 TaxID=3240021 RepID=UPI003D8D5D16
MSEPTLVLHEVLAAAGARSGRCDRIAGTPVPRTLVPVAAVVGTVARPGQFDRGFRPLTTRAAQRIADLPAAGLPPVRLVRVGALLFVEDGHHRVAAAVARGQSTVTAAIRTTCTVAAVPHGLRATDLPLLAAERDFLRAVPLPDAATPHLRLPSAAAYAELAERAQRWWGGPLDAAAAAAWWELDVRARPGVTTAAEYLAS